MKKRLLRCFLTSLLCFTVLLSSEYAVHTFAKELPEAKDYSKTEIEYFEMSTIPVVDITVDGGQEEVDKMNNSPDHSYKCTGSVTIRIPEGYACSYTETLPEKYENLSLEYIRGRGNSTWGIDKKPYKFKLDKKQDLFGMGENKHWVLLADRFDGSHVRNRLSLWLAEQFGLEYTPKCVPVDLTMNGEYYGHYLLCEQVRVDKNRVEIDELKENDVDPEIITGGYLLALNPYYEDPEENRFTTMRGTTFGLESPLFDPEEGYENETQKNYIIEYIQKTEDALFSEDFRDDDGNSYKEYLDLDSAVDYFLTEMITVNEDAYRTPSTYLYKKRNGKLYFGPVWDFDNTFGNTSEGENGDKYFIYDETPWIDRMRHDPEFVQKVKERWPYVEELITKIIRKGGILDQFSEEIKDSWMYDHAKWGTYTGNDHRKKWQDQEVEIIRTWLEKRKNWINDHLEDAGKTTYNLSFEADGEVIGTFENRIGNVVTRILPAPEKEGYYFDGWMKENGEYLRIFQPLYEDTLVKASYARSSSLLGTNKVEGTSTETKESFFRKTWVPPALAVLVLLIILLIKQFRHKN